MKKPNAFFVGTPRCGTWSLYNCFKKHPQIFVPKIKEPSYFNTDLYEFSNKCHKKQVYKRISSDYKYLRLYKSAKDEKVLVDMSTTYIFSATASKLIYEFNPESKIIIILRNPLEFLRSYHNICVYTLDEDIYDFNEALNSEKERRLGKKIPKNCKFPSLLQYNQLIRYYDYVVKYSSLFENLMIIVYDDFKNKYQNTYSKIMHFLEVEDIEPEIQNINMNMEIRYPSFNRILEKLHAKRLLSSLFGRLVSWPPVDVYKYILFKTQERGELLNEREIKLKFRPEVEKISRFLERDLVNEWGFQNL